MTIFSFGYHGWGTCTDQLVKAVDAVEKGRGFRPPIFVDTRIRRQGRAPGFVGNAFEDRLGPNRHRWMKDLGNESVVSDTGRRIQIRKPAAAAELLDLATQASEENRRVIFFCSCPWPRCEGKVACHRTAVGTLLLGAARRRDLPVELVEWPGGKPRRIRIELPSETFESVRKGRMTVPLTNPRPLAEFAGLPTGSIATLQSNGQSLHRVIGPAKWERGQWVLPVLWFYFDPDATLDAYRKAAAKFRSNSGLGVRSSVSQ